MTRYNFLAKRDQMLPEWLLLVDVGSACSMFRDSNLLTHLRKSSRHLDLVTDGGPFSAHVMGVFMDKMLVWHSEESVSNLLGFHQLAKHFRMACDATHEDVMFVNIDPDADAWI